MFARGMPLLAVAVAVAGCGSRVERASTPSSPAAVITKPALPPDATAAQHGVEVGDIDARKDPCADFYAYANGAWREANPIPPSMQRWSRRWAAAEATKEQLREILDDVSTRRDWPVGSGEQIIGDHYAACMDESQRNELGISPLAPLLGKIDAIRTSRDVQQVISQLHDLRIQVPFALDPSQDRHEPTRVIANVAASGLGLPDRDYYLSPERRFAEARERYRTHVAKTFQLAGLSEARAGAAANVVLAMEKQLAEASLDNVALREPKNLDHRVSVAELARLTPHMDWKSYLGRAHLELSDLNVEQPGFLKEFDRHLARTPVSTWKVYLTWQVLSDAAESLSAPFAAEGFAFDSYLGGAAENKPLWRRCVESTDFLFTDALGKKYVASHFPPAAKARAVDLVGTIVTALKRTIAGLPWMGSETKTKALEKLASLSLQIGYPDTWTDYGSVKVARDAFWSNVAAGGRFRVDKGRSSIGKPVNRTRWDYATPTTSNAYYDPLLNEIVFPAGILQPPAFSLEAVDAVNYGSIGVMIGHEIGHGFDDEGAQYDAVGRFVNWWTDADRMEFEKRSQCVVDQFESYFIEPGIHHNGKLVLGESISDLAGVKLAWLGFKEAQAARPGLTLDGLSPERQFFIAWGQFFGDAIRPETQRLMVQGDSHPTAKYRIIGPLSNLADFQKTFACKEGAPMVRATRCEVW